MVKFGDFIEPGSIRGVSNAEADKILRENPNAMVLNFEDIVPHKIVRGLAHYAYKKQMTEDETQELMDLVVEGIIMDFVVKNNCECCCNGKTYKHKRQKTN